MPAPGRPGRTPADRSPRGREAAGGLLGLYVSRWALGPAGFGDSFRTVSIFWPLEQRPGPWGPSVSGARRLRGPAWRHSGGAGRWGHDGLKAGQVRVSPRRTMTGWWCWGGVRRPGRTPGPRSVPRPRGRPVPTLAAAWVVSPSPEGRSSGLGAWKCLHCAARGARFPWRPGARALRAEILRTSSRAGPTCRNLCSPLTAPLGPRGEGRAKAWGNGVGAASLVSPAAQPCTCGDNCSEGGGLSLGPRARPS